MWFHTCICYPSIVWFLACRWCHSPSPPRKSLCSFSTASRLVLVTAGWSSRILGTFLSGWSASFRVGCLTLDRTWFLIQISIFFMWRSLNLILFFNKLDFLRCICGASGKKAEGGWGPQLAKNLLRPNKVWHPCRDIQKVAEPLWRHTGRLEK